jgi:hypothetical protein
MNQGSAIVDIIPDSSDYFAAAAPDLIAAAWGAVGYTAVVVIAGDCKGLVIHGKRTA